MGRRETADVLAKARRVYETAQLGLSDLNGTDPKRRIPGLWNAVTFGRAVTFALQNLRTIDAKGFDAWYLPRQSAMQNDPLMRYFNKLRTVIEKEGGPKTTSSFVIDRLDYSDIAEAMNGPRPPAALSFFFGDAAGGSGWEVETPDGQRVPFYVELPGTVKARWSIGLPDPPSTHLGQPIEDASAQHLCTLFLDYIGRLLAEAEAEFDGPEGV